MLAASEGLITPLLPLSQRVPTHAPRAVMLKNPVSVGVHLHQIGVR